MHRDLKPNNIMFKKQKIFENVEENEKEIDFDHLDLKLIDFGLCAELSDHTSDSLLNDKSGTVGYLAPELITKKKGEFYNEKVDVFSAGMVFYEMYFMTV